MSLISVITDVVRKVNTAVVDTVAGIFSSQEKKSERLDWENTTETSSLSATYYYKKMAMERGRLARYADYQMMDSDYVEIGAALDIYADNAAKPNEVKDGISFSVECKNPKHQNIIDELVKRLKLQDTVWDTARDMAKMGDGFDEVVVNDEKIIVRLKTLEPETMTIETDEYGRPLEKPYMQKDPAFGTAVANFFPWQIVHWKNSGMKRVYGDSILKPIRRVYKQLQMMEDGLVIGRLTRSHMRYKFLIDTEGLSPEEEDLHLDQVKRRFKKTRLINPTTGQLDVTDNPLTAQEDFFLSVKRDSKTDVGILQGSSNLGNIRDVNYFQDKLFIGLKVPKILLGFEEAPGSRATIIEKIIQFGACVGRLRRGLRIGLAQLFDQQLILLGEIPEEDDYKIEFTPFSMVDELRVAQIDRLKAEIAAVYKNIGVIDREYIIKNMLTAEDEEIERLLKVKEVPKSGNGASKEGEGSGVGTRVGKGGLGLRVSSSAGLASTGATGMKQTGLVKDDLADNGHDDTEKMRALVEELREILAL